MARRISDAGRRHALAAGLATATLMTATVASGQAERRNVMVMDNGSGPQVLHMTQPNFRDLREPDYVRTDLPIFTDKLALSDTQIHVVKSCLDEYLHAFHELATDMLPAPRGEMRAMHFGPGDHEHDREHVGGLELDGGDGIDAIVFDALGDDASGIDIDVDDMGGGGAIAVTIEAGAGGPAGGGGGGSGNELVGVVTAPGDGSVWATDGGGGGVTIAIESAGDVEIPEELRKRLEAKAQEMAERLADMEMEGGFADEDGGAMMFESIEDRQARFDELAESARKFKSRKAVLKSQFESDVQGQLSGDQLQRWPGLERTLTRRKSLPKGRLDGEKTDLIDVLESLEPAVAATEELSEQKDAYEQTLFGALVARDAYMEESASDIDEAIHAGEVDKALSIADRASALRVGVRNVNQQYAAAFAQRLEAADADRFRDAVLRRSHPRIYRTTTAERMFKAAGKLPDLDDNTRANIDTLEQAYRSERAVQDAKIRQTVLKHQPKETRQGIKRVGAIMQGESAMELHNADDPVHAAYAKRRDLDERYVESIRGLLSPEQLEQMPKVRKRGNQPIIIRESGRNPF